VEPVTAQNWADFEALFKSGEAPHYCWCTVYRVPSQPHLTNPEKKGVMCRLVEQGVPVGAFAYDGDKPVGWCSVAPRETYRKLDRARTMPRVTPQDVPAWTILCFFVLRPYRKKGVAKALVKGALDHARTQGAQVVEAYPCDTAGTSATHRGYSSLFERVGFQQEGTRWVLDLSTSWG
jgi:GNAT superfamily N-acetyltransferase